MVATVGTGAIIIRPDFSKFEASVRSFSGRAAGAMSAVTAAVTGAGLAGLVTFGIKSAASLEQAQVGFETMLGSGKRAQAFLTGLQRFAAATPFELPGLIDASRTLLGVGVAAKDVIPTLRAYGDAAGALGIQQDAFQRIMIAVSQSLSAGKIKLGDMNQLMNNGLPIWKLMSEAMHKPVPELQKLISHGQLLSKDVLPKLQAQMEKDYGGAMARQSQTLAGVWSTLKDTVAIGLANAIKPLVPLLEDFVPKAATAASAAIGAMSTGMAAFISGLQQTKGPTTGFVGYLHEAGAAMRTGVGYAKALGGEAVRLSEYLKQNADTVKLVAQIVAVAAASYVSYRAALYAVEVATKAVAAAQRIWAAVQATISFVQLASQVRSLSEAWVLLDAAMDANPIGIVVAAIAALAGALYLAWTHSSTFRKIVIGAWDGVKIAISATVNWIVHTVWPYIKVVWDAIASGAVALWHILATAWNAIRGAVATVVNWFTGTLWPAIKIVWNAIVAATLDLYHKFDPIWKAIGWVVHTASAVIQLAIAIVVAYVKNVLVPAYLWLWHSIVEPVWKGISKAVQIAVAVVRLELAIIVAFFQKVVAPAAMWLWHNVFVPVFNGVKAVVSANIAVVRSVISALVSFFRSVVAPAALWLWHTIFQPAFNGIKTATQAMWNFVKPILTALGNFVKGTLVSAFKTAVSAIKGAWDGLKAAAKAPVTFVVNSVINPLIGGFNKLARIFHTPTIEPIGGFAEGGKIPGSPSARDNRLAWLKNKSGQVIGNLAVATGEFVVNARDTAKALPLLQWINAGMKGGPAEVARRLGRPVADMPGDGSEGWAFAKGGLVGFLSDVWGAISNPAKAIKAPLEDALGRIPGGGLIRDFLVGMGHKLIDGFLGWISGTGTGGAAPGSVGKAQRFLAAQNGKPYIWASAGPNGYDCSGIVSSVYNILKGKNPYRHTFSTETAGQFFPKRGLGGPLIAAWSHPGQAPASASVGHMMGMVGGLRFESTGSRGVHLGPSTRNINDFANIGHFDHGGLIRLAKIASADFGRVTLSQGHNLIYNGTGKPEPLESPRPASPTGRMHPADIAALAQAIGSVVGGALTSTIPMTRVAGRQIGKRP